jgi:release factor glutamine methyltransferase
MKLLLETLKAGTGYLEKHGVDEARLNMEHLLAHVLQCRRLELYLRFNEMLDEECLTALRGLIKRRGEGEPLQHLLGTVEFCGHEFICDHRALVPRPETERLVELLGEKLAANPPVKVLDVGTGSGCIGLSLARMWSKPGTEFTLIDVSEDALELARLNASRLGLAGQSVRFIRSDLFEKVEGPFDLIVANLPYIPSGEIATLSMEVRRDPLNALDGGPDGLVIIDRLLKEAGARLSPGAWVALEIGHDQAAEVSALCASAGLEQIEAVRDLAGIERFVFARQSAASN